jgi:hypothetical protein
VAKSKKSKKKTRRRVVVEVTLGPGEQSTPVFETGVWYVASPTGGFTTGNFSKSDTVMVSASGVEGNAVMDAWMQDYPGRRWGFCISLVESDGQGGLRRVPQKT